MNLRILTMYITARSGHYQAARALKEAIRSLEPQAEVLTIDAFQYLNPILARIVDRMYLSMIQKMPELWDYLYDNPAVARRSIRFRRLLHRYDSPRLRGLLDEFLPHAVVCTQAFPSGLVADYKQDYGWTTPLFAVLTDFMPHAYWIHEQVDGFVVPCEKARQWFLDRNVPRHKVHVLGIPIDPVFAQPMDPVLIRSRLKLDLDLPAILMMGGGQGLGPILEAVLKLDGILRPFQILVVTGSNESLYHRLIARIPSLRHPVRVFGHIDFVAELMTVATLIVTKPGGLTSSEALAKGLPIVALSPIPGQEVKNAACLVEEGAARLVTDLEALPAVVEDLLANGQALQEMAANAQRLGKPNSAIDSARLILEHACRFTSVT